MEQKVAKLSKEIVDQLPSFVRQDHQTFIAFLEAYYAYMEQNGKTQYVIDNLKSYTDIDTTIDDFVDYFLAQYAFTLPRSVFEANATESKRLFVKHTSSFYRSKGAESSYRLLFRLLYGEEISFFYPETVLLEPSSGKWVRRKTLKIENLDNLEVSNFRGKKAISSSGATAIIDYASLYEENGFVLIELNSENDSLDGEFLIGDTITIEGLGTFTPLNTISSIEIINPGRGYTANTPLTIINGENAKAFIESVDQYGSITKIGLRVPGIGIDDPNITIMAPVPDKTISGTYQIVSGNTTIKLNSPHGLKPGDYANVIFETGGGSSFSNTFQIVDTFGVSSFEFSMGILPDQSSPVQIGSSMEWKGISAGSHYTIATKTDGTLWGWGYTHNYQLGLGDNTSHKSYPVQIGSDDDWLTTSTYTAHVTAIKTDGTLWAWGANNEGQLGTSDLIWYHTPVQVGSDTNWASIACGEDHSLAIKTDGTLYSWGKNTSGQLGQGDTVGRSFPLTVADASGWSQVSAGSVHSAGIKNDGTLWTWGFGGSGRLGHGNTSTQVSPVKVGTMTNWKQVSCGEWFTMAVRTDGTLWAFGSNGYGQLGTGDMYMDKSTPTQVGTDTDWDKVIAGRTHTFGIKTDGSLWAWGDNLYGGLGINDTINRDSPVRVGLLTDWKNISAGNRFTVGLKNNNTLWSWGENGIDGIKLGIAAEDSSGNVTINFNIPEWQANLVAHRGIITNYEGTYGRNFDGQLDHQIKLQDSHFYQKYSYVIRSNIGIDTWRDVVKSVLHPAGWAMFGELLISNEIGEEAIYVGPLGNAIDSILIILRTIINETNAVFVGVETVTPMINLGITGIYNALFGYVGLGGTRETVDRFKFDYADITIENYADYTIGFFTEESNVNLLYNIPPPSEIRFE